MTVNKYSLSGCLTHISFSNLTDKPQQYMLAATEYEAALFDYDTLKILKSFPHFHHNFTCIRQIGFLPNNIGQLYARFSDDSLAIWSDTNFEKPKLIRPFEVRQQFLERTHAIKMNLSPQTNLTDAQIAEQITVNTTNSRLEYVTFSSDAKAMCVTSSDGHLMTFKNQHQDNNWHVDKVFRTNGSIASQCMFVSLMPPYEYLFCVTSGGDLTLVSLNKPSFFVNVQSSLTKSMVMSANSLMLGATLIDGECLIFSLPEIIEDFQTKILEYCDVSLPKPPTAGESINKISKSSLQRMLSLYSEYPAKYRPIIWELLMELPENTDAFSVLVQKGLHPCTMDLEQRYPLSNASEMQKLKCICSFLANWCKVSISHI